LLPSVLSRGTAAAPALPRPGAAAALCSVPGVPSVLSPRLLPVVASVLSRRNAAPWRHPGPELLGAAFGPRGAFGSQLCCPRLLSLVLSCETAAAPALPRPGAALELSAPEVPSVLSLGLPGRCLRSSAAETPFLGVASARSRSELPSVPGAPLVLNLAASGCCLRSSAVAQPPLRRCPGPEQPRRRVRLLECLRFSALDCFRMLPRPSAAESPLFGVTSARSCSELPSVPGAPSVLSHAASGCCR